MEAFTRRLRHYLSWMFVTSFAAAGSASWCHAAELAPPLPPAPEEAAVPPSAWMFQFVPYGWLISLDGTQTVRGRSVKVNASFLDIVENSDSLLALMGTVEARRGPFTLYGDLVWSSVGADAGSLRTRTLAPGVTTTVGRSLSVDINMAIVEAGASYEVMRSGALAFDILGGARYWHQEADVSFEAVRTAQVGDLDLVGGLAIARSGSFDWIDPVVGARLRYAMAPGHNLFLRGDIGGFGVGSRFSWQAVGGYVFDFGAYHGITFSGVVGYRALFVDYAQGSGRQRYEFDMTQHGPILGISAPGF